MATVLGNKLRQIRQLRGLSLRKVEAQTGISNAYLSQLERGDAKNPSPKKLKSLAECYDVEYAELLRYAGYLPNDDSSHISLIATSEPVRTPSALSSAIQDSDLTEDEENLVAQYILFIKSQRK